MHNIYAILKKEMLHIMRDRRTLALIVMMPLFQLVLYGYAIRTDVRHLATSVYNEDRTSLSRRLIETFHQSAYFDVSLQVDSYEELHRGIDRGRVKLGIHIPPGFARDILAGRQSQLQMLIDGTDSTPANTALNVGQALVPVFLQREGLGTEKDEIPLIDFRPRMWYNPDLLSSFFLIPGLVGLLLQILIPMITATAIVREKERGNLEQLLVTPVKRHELIIGKLIPYVLIGILISLLILSTAHYLFRIPIRGNVVLLMVLVMLFLVVCLGMGILASTIAENQQQAAQIVLFFAPPSILLSGFIFPRDSMPWIINQISNLIPLTHFVVIARGIVLKGLGAIDLWPQIAALSIMAFVIITVSILKFKKRLS